MGFIPNGTAPQILNLANYKGNHFPVNSAPAVSHVAVLFFPNRCSQIIFLAVPFQKLLRLEKQILGNNSVEGLILTDPFLGWAGNDSGL